MRIRNLTLMLATAVALFAQADVTLQKAMRKETLEGDLKGAIVLYEKAVAEAKNDRAMAAKALMRLAECHRKLGDTEAQKIYEQVARDYADQKEAAAQARAALGVGAAARSGTLAARQIWSGPGVHFTSSLGPDGRSWATLDTATGDLAIRDLVTGTTKRLLLKTNWTESGEYCDWPLLSPDQKRIVYAWFSTQEPRGYELRIVDAEPGAKPRTLVRNPEFAYFEPAAWARDGKSVLAAVGSRESADRLVWISPADGSMKPLKSLDWRKPGRPSLSPDGKFLAYDSLVNQGSKDREVRIIAADGSVETVAVPAPGVNESPIWTPDGRRLVFTSNRSGTVGLWSIAVRDGKAAGAAQLAKPDIGDILPKGFTQAGSFYYIHRRDELDVFSQEFDQTGKLRGEPVRLAGTYVGRNFNPEWSPDDESVAYFSNRGQPPSMALVVRSLKSGQERTFPVSFDFPGQPIWSPDGERIIVAAQDRQWHVCLYGIDLKTGAVREVLNTAAPGAANAVLSPDGKTAFLVLGTPENGGAVAAFDLDTGRRTDVFSGIDGIPSLAMSRDGTLAVMVAPRPGARDRVRLYTMQADGSGRREIYTQETGDRFGKIAWAPDGRAIYFCQLLKTGFLQLWRIPANGGAPGDAGVLPSTTPAGGIALNRNGSRLIFHAGSRNQGELWALDNLGAVLVTPGK